MWNKIYALALVVATLVMIILSYLSFSQLQAIGFSPATIADNFRGYESMFREFLWISSLILLIVANVGLWQTRRSSALWLTLLYFAVFVLLDTWWLGSFYFDYRKQNNLTADSFSFSGIFGVILCVSAALVVFFDQFIVLRMRDRMHGEPQAAVGTNSETTAIPPDAKI